MRLDAAIELIGMGVDGEDAIPALTEALKDEDPLVRSAAQAALKTIKVSLENEEAISKQDN